MNLFIVETPHQLFNAIEARAHFPATRSTVILACLTTYSYESFLEVLKDQSWDGVHRIESANRKKDSAAGSRVGVFGARVRSYYRDWRRRRRVDSIARDVGAVVRLFLGNYNVNYMRHLANRIRCDGVYLLDDGTATLAINDRRKSTSGDDRLEFTASRRRLVRETLLGFRAKRLSSVTFFTTYDIEVAAGDRLVKNDYSYFRSLAMNHEPSDDIFFLGQPMVEEGILQRDTFVNYLRQVKAHFGERHVVYLPHKREASEKVEMLQRDLGFGVKRFDVPIEYQMSVRGTRPKILASFFSSALENSRVIFGELMPIKCFRIKPEDFVARREYVSLIYDYYLSKRGEHFEIVG